MKELSRVIGLGVPEWGRYGTSKYGVEVDTMEKGRIWSSRHLGKGMPGRGNR